MPAGLFCSAYSTTRTNLWALHLTMMKVSNSESFRAMLLCLFFLLPFPLKGEERAEKRDEELNF